MDVRIEHRQFKKAVGFVGRIVPRKSPKPVLENILIRCDPEPGLLRFFATDLDCEVSSVISAEIDRPGTVLLPHHRLQQMLGSIEGSFRLTLDGESVEIGTGWLGTNASFTLATRSTDDYPAPGLILEDGPGHWTCSGSALAAALNATSVAVDVESTRYALGGVRFERSDDGGLSLVGTDGRRLHLARLGPDVAAAIGEPYSPGASTGGVLPAKACKLVVDLAEEAGEELVRFTLGPNRLAFAAGASFVAARPTEGRFPRWQEILPNESGSVVTFAVPDDLGRVVSQAAITTSEESRSVLVEIDADGLTASSRAADVGKARVDGTHGGLQGDPVYFACDPRYLTNALGVIRSDDGPLTMKVIDHKTAVVMESGNLTFVVMPVTIEGRTEWKRLKIVRKAEPAAV